VSGGIFGFLLLAEGLSVMLLTTHLRVDRWKRRVTEDVTTGVHTMCFLSVVLTIGAVTLVAMSPRADDKQRHQQPRVVDRNKERFD
jgi:hypothetical protein